MDEKKAHLKTLTTSDKPDMAAVNSTIDEISTLKGKMMKSQVNHRLAVRSLLDSKQQFWFDNYGKGKCGKNMHGKRPGLCPKMGPKGMKSPGWHQGGDCPNGNGSRQCMGQGRFRN